MDNYDALAGTGAVLLLVLTGIIILIGLAVAIINLVSLWKIFKKANKPGWAAIIPIYNIVVLLQITNIPVWTIVVLFIPLINAVGGAILNILICVQLAKAFKKEDAFIIGLILVPIIFYPILAFGKSEYSEVKALF
ncbi:MAG: DUF5684 domain-containing protein [Bacilli bacterium]|nr:DUF5684 domain-containing protein [Bacilli bacterium]